MNIRRTRRAISRTDLVVFDDPHPVVHLVDGAVLPPIRLDVSVGLDPID